MPVESFPEECDWLFCLHVWPSDELTSCPDLFTSIILKDGINTNIAEVQPMSCESFFFFLENAKEEVHRSRQMKLNPCHVQRPSEVTRRKSKATLLWTENEGAFILSGLHRLKKDFIYTFHLYSSLFFCNYLTEIVRFEYTPSKDYFLFLTNFI